MNAQTALNVIAPQVGKLLSKNDRRHMEEAHQCFNGAHCLIKCNTWYLDTIDDLNDKFDCLLHKMPKLKSLIISICFEIDYDGLREVNAIVERALALDIKIQVYIKDQNIKPFLEHIKDFRTENYNLLLKTDHDIPDLLQAILKTLAETGKSIDQIAFEPMSSFTIEMLNSLGSIGDALGSHVKEVRMAIRTMNSMCIVQSNVLESTLKALESLSSLTIINIDSHIHNCVIMEYATEFDDRKWRPCNIITQEFVESLKHCKRLKRFSLCDWDFTSILRRELLIDALVNNIPKGCQVMIKGSGLYEPAIIVVIQLLAAKGVEIFLDACSVNHILNDLCANVVAAHLNYKEYKSVYDNLPYERLLELLKVESKCIHALWEQLKIPT